MPVAGRAALALFCWIIPAVWFIGAPAADGGSIRMTTRIDVTTDADRVRAAVDVCNEGSADARHVESTLALSGVTHQVRVADRLGGGACASFTVEWPLSAVEPGSHPLEMVTRYADTRNHPYSAVHCMEVRIGEVPETALASQAGAMNLVDFGQLSWTVENTAPMTRSVTASLFLPDELAVKQARHILNLGPSQKKTVTFHIENRFALAGAAYPVYVAFAYADDRGIHTRVDRTLVSIGAGHRWFEKGRWWVLAVGLVCLSGYALILWRKGGAGRPFRRPVDTGSTQRIRRRPADNIS